VNVVARAVPAWLRDAHLHGFGIDSGLSEGVVEDQSFGRSHPAGSRIAPPASALNSRKRGVGLEP